MSRELLNSKARPSVYSRFTIYDLRFTIYDSRLPSFIRVASFIVFGNRFSFFQHAEPYSLESGQATNRRHRLMATDGEPDYLIEDSWISHVCVSHVLFRAAFHPI